MPALPRDGDPGQEQDGYPGTGENPPVEARFVSEIPEPSLQDDIGGRSGDRERRYDQPDKAAVQPQDDFARSGAVHFADADLLGPELDDEGHVDNQAEVGDQQAQQRENADQFPCVQLVAEYLAVHVADERIAGRVIGENLFPDVVEGLQGPGLVGVEPDHDVVQEQRTLHDDHRDRFLAHAGVVEVVGHAADDSLRDVADRFVFDPQGLAYDLLGRVVSQRFKSLPVDHVFFLQVCGFLVVG